MCFFGPFKKCFKKKETNWEDEFEFLSMTDVSMSESEQNLRKYYTTFYNRSELAKKLLTYRELLIKELVKEMIKRGRTGLINQIGGLDTEILEVIMDYIIEIDQLKSALNVN